MKIGYFYECNWGQLVGCRLANQQHPPAGDNRGHGLTMMVGPNRPTGD